MAENPTVVGTNLEKEEGQHQCVLCCDNVEIYALGVCDHPICFRCSSRMRVLAHQRYCAVCRTTLDQVAFSKKLVNFSDIKLRKMPGARKYGIRFSSQDCSEAFNNLLEATCPVCENKQPFPSFNELRTHVRKAHNCQYCDICTEHLHIFPSEFTVYNRKDLIKHRKGGDVKNTSHRGHPLCNFCDERYYDNDELLLHLRKNHFWCHFCENDGKQEYYCNYDDLREHFREDHFLCEEESCKVEKYTSVFRTKIDLKAHKLSSHSNKLSKAAAKQARQLDIDIDYGSRRKGKRGTATSAVNSEAARPPREAEAEVPERMLNASSGNASPPSLGAAVATSSNSGVNGSATTHLESNYPTIKENNNQSARQTQNISAKQTPASSTSAAETTHTRPSTSIEKTTANVVSKSSGPTTQFKDNAWEGAIHASQQLSEQNFPALTSASQVAVRAKQVPPGFNRVVKRSEPPGFSNSGTRPKQQENNWPHLKKEPQSSQRHMGHPVAGNKIQQSRPPGLTKPNASEETSFQERNELLIMTIRNLMSSDDFCTFRLMSGQYRKGERKGHEYYDGIKLLLGDNLNDVFSELVGLLPDASKRSELLAIHGEKKSNFGDNGYPKDGKSCKEQKKQFSELRIAHTELDADFPALQPRPQKKSFSDISSRGSAPPARNVWMKGK